MSRLGKVLDRITANLGGDGASVLTPPPQAGPDPKNAPLRRTSRRFMEVDLVALMPDPEQPRRTILDDELDELAASIGKKQLHPAKVYWSEVAKCYVLVYGEKRLRAAQRAGLASLLCEVLSEPPGEAEVLEEQLAENGAGRSAPPPVETGAAYRRLMDLRGWTEVELAKFLGVAQSTVSNRLGLARMPEPVKDLLRAGTLSTSAAVELLRAPEDAQVELAIAAAGEGKTRDQVRAEVNASLGRPAKISAADIPPPDRADRFVMDPAGVTITPPPEGPQEAPGEAEPAEDAEGEDSPVRSLGRIPGPPAGPDRGIPSPDRQTDRKILDWTLLGDLAEFEAMYNPARGRSVCVYLPEGSTWAHVAELLADGLRAAHHRAALAQVLGGPAEPDGRVRLERPGHKHHGKAGRLTGRFNDLGWLYVRLDGVTESEAHAPTNLWIAV